MQEREYDRLPRHLRKEWERAPTKVDANVSSRGALLPCIERRPFRVPQYPLPVRKASCEANGVVDDGMNNSRP